jgi:hypothetical protein
MSGSLPDQSQQMCYFKPSQQSQHHTQTNAFASQQELSNWTKVSYKRGRSTRDETERETKHAEESEHLLNQTSTSDRYTALLEEENCNQHHRAGPENTPIPPLITGVKNISPLVQLLEQISINCQR